MNIAVIAGSPKGANSITLQYVKYLQKKFPQHQFLVQLVGQQINKLEADAPAFQAVLDSIRAAEVVLWCFPVYFLMAPYQLKRFIELIGEKQVAAAFQGKYATAITTSVHYFDHTAHNYIQAVSEDLGLRYVKGFSADMEDLLQVEARTRLEQFARHFFRIVTTQAPVTRDFPPLPDAAPDYQPEAVVNVPKTGNRKILVVTDADEHSRNLTRMIEAFTGLLPNAVEVINLHQLHLQGGCLGCCRCAENNECVYQDDLVPLFRNRVMPAEALVLAGTIRDRYLSSRWKMFFDRSFFNGHRPILCGTPTAWIISGPLRHLPNLRQILEGQCGTGGQPLVGIVTDEAGGAERITALLKELGQRILEALAEGAGASETFLGVGGQKIFRDLVYDLSFFFQSDYRFYQTHGLLDYPQKNLRARFKKALFRAVMLVPAVRRRFYQQGARQMVAPLQAVVDGTQKEPSAQ